MAWPFKKAAAGGAPAQGSGISGRFSAWRAKRTAAKAAAPAPAAAPSEVGALEKLGGGAKSTLYSGLSAAKGKSGWAIVIAIVVAVGYFLYGLATGFVGFFSAVPFYFQILIIGIILSILVGAGAKSGSAAMGIFVFFIILTFAVWYLMEIPGGQQIMGKIEVGTIQTVGPLQKVTSVLNKAQALLYNPDNLWQSENAQSTTAQDVGVTLNNVAPLRDPFYSGQDLSVQGRLNAVSYPGSNVTAKLDACYVVDPLASQDCAGDWTCTPSSLKVSVARNRLFNCNHSSVTIPPEGEIYTVKLKATAEGTQTVSGKQFAFADVDALLALDPKADQLAALGISSDNIRSFQEGDQSLNIGIGIAGDPEVLEADTTDKAIDYYLGVNIENTVSQTGVAEFPNKPGYELALYLPTYFLSPQSGKNEDFTCTNLTEDQKLR
ncbi:MAG: hypothetical protein NTY99_01870 [DPANN group archaeon]|nr:hypothetical protein [DPANN group archaeon]